MPTLVVDDLPETGSFEIIRGALDRREVDGQQGGIARVDLPTIDCPPVYIDSSWHGRHGISRFSAEVLRRLRIPRRYITSGTVPATRGDVIASWRLRLKSSDVVYSPGFNAGLSRARQVLTLHDLIHLSDRDEASIAKRAYYERLVRPAIRRTGTVLTVSEVSRSAIREWIRDDDVQVVNVGNGCSELFFQPLRVRRDTSQILYVGNLKPHKNPTPVFAALSGLPGMRLTVVSSEVQEARSLAAAHGVADRVEIVPSCTDRELKALYAASGALVVPSLREGFGLPAVEALAVGTPVVHWSGCASVAEVVGDHGLAVTSASDPDEWRHSIIAAVGGARGFERPGDWRERWSWNGVAGRIDEALQAVGTR